MIVGFFPFLVIQAIFLAYLCIFGIYHLYPQLPHPFQLGSPHIQDRWQSVGVRVGDQVRANLRYVRLDYIQRSLPCKLIFYKTNTILKSF